MVFNKYGYKKYHTMIDNLKKIIDKNLPRINFDGNFDETNKTLSN